jgi:hypothetical protein
MMPMCSYILGWQIYHMVWVCCLEVGKRRIWHSWKNLAVMVMTARHPNGNALLLVILSLCSCQSNALPRRELSSWGTIHFYLGWHGGQSIGSNTRNGFVIVCLWGIDHHSPFCWHVHKELRMHLAGSRLWISKYWWHILKSDNGTISKIYRCIFSSNVKWHIHQFQWNFNHLLESDYDSQLVQSQPVFVGGFTLKNKSVMWDVGPSKVIESTKQFTALWADDSFSGKKNKKKQVQSLDAKICQINLHHHYLLVMYTSIQGWFNSY